MSDDSVQKEYDEYVRKFCDKFEDGIKIADERNNTKTGFVFVFVREIDPGCIDVASNLSSDSVKNVLEMALSNTVERIDESLGEFNK
jgi:hypothetical protein